MSREISITDSISENVDEVGSRFSIEYRLISLQVLHLGTSEIEKVD